MDPILVRYTRLCELDIATARTLPRPCSRNCPSSEHLALMGEYFSGVLASFVGLSLSG